MIKRSLALLHDKLRPGRRAKLLQQSKHEAYNAAYSRLYRIPSELILLVADRLDAPSVLALRMVSRKFAMIIATPTKIQEDERAVYRKMLVHDEFSKECERDREQSLRRRAVCAGCLTTHQLSLFAPEELVKDPEYGSAKAGAASSEFAHIHVSA